MSEKETANKTEQSAAPLIIIGVLIVAIALGLFVVTSNSQGKKPEAPAEQVAEVDNTDPNPVVAKIGNQEIRRQDIVDYVASLPEQIQQIPLREIFPMALDQFIGDKIIDEKVEAASLKNDPEVQKRLKEYEEQIMRTVYVERAIDERITEERVRERYVELANTAAKKEELRARHILVETEEKARELIQQLDGGADFGQLAAENSTGPTAVKQGDLGYFTKDMMVAEFSDAADALEKGAYTKEPVKTQFGWHVIKLEDRREKAFPPFEAVKDQIESQMRQQAISEILDDWRQEAGVETYGFNGAQNVSHTE